MSRIPIEVELTAYIESNDIQTEGDIAQFYSSLQKEVTKALLTGDFSVISVGIPDEGEADDDSQMELPLEVKEEDFVDE